MNKKFHTFVRQIVSQTDGTRAEKEDMYEELMIHLELSYAQFIEAGYNKKQSEKMTLQSFGDANKIGNQLQQAMFPYRKMMFLILAVTSLLYSFTLYSVTLFAGGNAHIAWLVISVVTSSSILLFSLQMLTFLERKISLNIMLTIHIFVYLFGLLIASYIEFFIPLSYISIFILVLTIVLIYRTTIYDFPVKQLEGKNYPKLFHYFNLTFGFIIISTTLFFVWVVLIFAEAFAIFMLTPLIPVLIWIVTYIAQMKLVLKGKVKTAFVVAIIPFLLTLVIILWFSGIHLGFI